MSNLCQKRGKGLGAIDYIFVFVAGWFIHGIAFSGLS